MPLLLCSLPLFKLQQQHQQNKYARRLPWLCMAPLSPARTAHKHSTCSHRPHPLHPPTHTVWGAQPLAHTHTNKDHAVLLHLLTNQVPGVVAACSESCMRWQPPKHQADTACYSSVPHPVIPTQHSHTHTQADEAPMQWLLPRLHESGAAAHNPSNQTHTCTSCGGRSDAAVARPAQRWMHHSSSTKTDTGGDTASKTLRWWPTTTGCPIGPQHQYTAGGKRTGCEESTAGVYCTRKTVSRGGLAAAAA